MVIIFYGELVDVYGYVVIFITDDGFGGNNLWGVVVAIRIVGDAAVALADGEEDVVATADFYSCCGGVDIWCCNGGTAVVFDTSG